MTRARVLVVTGGEELRGSIETTVWPLDGSKAEVLVQFDADRRVLVPFKALSRQDDGSYTLDMEAAELERRQVTDNDVGGEALVVPVIVEEPDIAKRRGETGRTYIRKVVREREERVDVPLLRDEVLIERIPINQFVEQAVPVRYEGDVMIVSLLEEVLVVEKRLMLKEELRITRRQVEAHQPVYVTLRREEATVDHVKIEADKSLTSEEKTNDQDCDRVIRSRG